VTAQLYNVLGQKVHTLFSGTRGPGEHDFFWTGRDAQGALLPSGTYFYELRSAKQVLKKKTSIAR
jgi:flagellar hook assembly protein FlgD